MQSASRRALSSLAAKLHPPVPLTPRESQQLLELLTTSFRTHLNHEHPVSIPETHSGIRSNVTTKKRGMSSRSLAVQHLDSILTNPLIARKPQRRASESTAVDVIKNPLSWFLDQIALGAADIPKAALCLRLLRVDRDQGGTWLTTAKEQKFASAMADWLQTSGLDTSKEFLEMVSPSKGIKSLVDMLLAEGNQAPLWRWFTRRIGEWTEEIDMDISQVQTFRYELLGDMIISARHTSLDMAFTIFLRAHNMALKNELDLTPMIIRSAGAKITNKIIRHPHSVRSAECSAELYDSFLLSTSEWLGGWSKAVQPMLYLYHPTKPSAQPGLAFIKDPQGAITHVKSTKRKKQFLVHLCLAVARRLLAEEKYSDAQVVMNFTKEHLAEFVLHKMPSTSYQSSNRAMQTEEHNLAILDRLLPT
jgi:hypothetical protein